MTMLKTTQLLALTLVACSGDALDVGQDVLPTVSGGTGASAGTGAGTGGGGSSGTGSPLPDWTDLGACPTTGVEAPELVGTWEGAVEDFNFDPVVPLRLVITQATSDGVCGQLSWDTAATVPLPLTDPAQSGSDYGLGGASNFPVPGLTYTIVRGTARDGVLRFEVPAFEHWRGFCEVQEPHFSPSLRAYSCIEPYSRMTFSQNEDGNPGDLCSIHTSQGWLDLPLKHCGCEYTCTCNAEGCTAILENSISFDLVLDRNAGGQDVLVSGEAPMAVQSVRVARLP
jgi:hypothetical protein